MISSPNVQALFLYINLVLTVKWRNCNGDGTLSWYVKLGAALRVIANPEAIAAVFVLLLFLYESFAAAIAILVMPLLAVCAVFIGLWVTGIELNITAMMGMTMIVGIVTVVAIFFFSEFVDLAAGRPVPMALVEAGQNRMRPITMTTLAAILTFCRSLSRSARVRQCNSPSGLVVQLPLVLLVMPSIFLLLRRSGGNRGDTPRPMKNIPKALPPETADIEKSHSASRNPTHAL
jgi:predicted RND superfamily exporter protein